MFGLPSGSFLHNMSWTCHVAWAADRYVIIGAHIDSMTMGAVDAGTGYAVLMELVRVFSRQRKQSGRWAFSVV